MFRNSIFASRDIGVHEIFAVLCFLLSALNVDCNLAREEFREVSSRNTAVSRIRKFCRKSD